LQKLGQEEKILRTKINDFGASNEILRKRSFENFGLNNARNQNYFPKLKQEPRLKNFFKEDEIRRISQKKLLTEEEEKSENRIRPAEIEWNRSPQSGSDNLPEQNEREGEEEDEEDKNIDLSALRSEETLEFRRKPKTPNGKSLIRSIKISQSRCQISKMYLLRRRVK